VNGAMPELKKCYRLSWYQTDVLLQGSAPFADKTTGTGSYPNTKSCSSKGMKNAVAGFMY